MGVLLAAPLHLCGPSLGCAGVERSEWSDDEPFGFRPPLPPEDRVWRHPSELGGVAGPGAANFVASPRSPHPARARIALAVAVSATGALLVAALVSSAFRTGGGGAAATVEPSASSFSFAPTTARDLPDLGRPAEGAVYVVATTSAGLRVASGVVLDARGTVATTAAAVIGASAIVVYLADGTRQRASLLGIDNESGAAVVRVSAQPLAASSGWAVTLSTGDTVHTGGGAATATVEALGANATADNGQSLSHLVRLDLAGDATVAEGTPLFDDHERVVGLSTHTSDAHHLYAVPIEIPRAAARSINVHGRVVVPWLGVTGDDEAGTSGAKVQSAAADSPAMLAGLQAGDVIVSMDGQPIDSMAMLALSMRDYDAGAMVDLAYVRAGQMRHASAVLTERPSNA
jgi:S1-C subfamily serine protease